jgi:hypothetical protein
VADVVKKRVRTCVGCGAQSTKGELYRIVRTSDGQVRFDATGRAAGRGAYVCSHECFNQAASKGKLQKALRCAMGKEETAAIADELEKALVGASAR